MRKQKDNKMKISREFKVKLKIPLLKMIILALSMIKLVKKVRVARKMIMNGFKEKPMGKL